MTFISWAQFVPLPDEMEEDWIGLCEECLDMCSLYQAHTYTVVQYVSH